MNLRQKSIKTFVRLFFLCFLFILLSCQNEILLHTISFQADGNIIQTTQITHGDPIKIQPIPSAIPEGKEFAFWSLDGANPYDFNTPVTSDITLKAVWDTAKCKITFINGFSTTYIYIDYGTTIKENDYENPPSEEGREFLFWSIDGSTKYDFSNPITEDLTLHAVWENITYEVTFMDGTELIYSIELNEGETIQEIPGPETPDKTFKFWSVDGINPYDFNAPVNSNITLHAIWDDIQYEVTFMSDAHTEFVSLFFPSGSSLITPYITAPEGKELAYWSTLPDGSIKYNLDSPVTSNLVLYAVWKNIEYKVIFKYNNDVIKEITVPYGNLVEEIEAPETDYAFSFWSENGTTEFDFTSPIYSDTTLYAIYNTEAAHAVIFMNGNDVFFIDTDVPHNTQVEKIDPPEIPDGKSGFLFWSTAERDTGEYNFSSPIQGDLTLYAIWMPSPLEYTQDDNDIIITGVSDNSLTEIEIPYGVTEIADNAFEDCNELQTIILPDSIKNIGSNAFSNCTSLEQINIPNNLTIIKENLFYNCSSLTEINLPDSISSIETSSFEGCSSLSTINTPENLSEIATRAFYGCSQLSSIALNTNIKSIGDYAFYGCSELSFINIPDNVTSIGMHTFEACSNLKEVSLSKNLTNIPDSTFKDCSSLTTIKIPLSIRTIEQYSFSGCTALSQIVLPDSILYIGKNAFENCTNLTEITIPDSVLEIGASSFENCTNLTKVILPNTITALNENLFRGCSSLTENNYK